MDLSNSQSCEVHHVSLFIPMNNMKKQIMVNFKGRDKCATKYRLINSRMKHNYAPNIDKESNFVRLFSMVLSDKIVFKTLKEYMKSIIYLMLWKILQYVV